VDRKENKNLCRLFGEKDIICEELLDRREVKILYDLEKIGVVKMIREKVKSRKVLEWLKFLGDEEKKQVYLNFWYLYGDVSWQDIEQIIKEKGFSHYRRRIEKEISRRPFIYFHKWRRINSDGGIPLTTYPKRLKDFDDWFMKRFSPQKVIPYLVAYLVVKKGDYIVLKDENKNLIGFLKISVLKDSFSLLEVIENREELAELIFFDEKETESDSFEEKKIIFKPYEVVKKEKGLNNLEFIKADLRDLDKNWEKEKVDWARIFNVLMHYSHKQACQILSSISGIVKEGGLIFEGAGLNTLIFSQYRVKKKRLIMEELWLRKDFPKWAIFFHPKDLPTFLRNEEGGELLSILFRIYIDYLSKEGKWEDFVKEKLLEKNYKVIDERYTSWIGIRWKNKELTLLDESEENIQDRKNDGGEQSKLTFSLKGLSQIHEEIKSKRRDVISEIKEYQLEKIKELRVEDIRDENIAELLMTLSLKGKKGKLAKAILTEIYLKKAEDVDRVLGRLGETKAKVGLKEET